MRSRRVAVLGGAGFIGKHLVARLEADGHEVAVADIRSAHAPVDLRLAGETNEFFHTFQPEWVCCLAADMGGVGYFHGNHDYWPYIHNSLITINALVASAGRGVERFLYASSACAYPTNIQQDVTAPALTENLLDTGPPDQMYGREKLAGLRLCERAPFDARVAILHTVYGPGQETTGERAKFPPSVARKAIESLNTGSLRLWGTGEQRRSYLYIDDAISRLTRILYADNYDGPVNVGYQGAISCRGAAEICLDIVGSDAEIIGTEDGPTGVVARDCSNDKWVATYGPTDDIPPTVGFRKLIEWIKG